MSGSLMNIGMRALFANNAQMSTTAHNIANAAVDGYSRQEVQLETNKGQFTGAGFFGRGVNVANVTRVHNEFLTRQAAESRAQASMDKARHTQLSQLEDVFPPGEEGVGYAMGDFLASMTDLANTPADASARQVVLARAADAADRFASSAARLDVLQAGVTADLKTSAETLNGLIQQVATLNQQIASAKGLNGQPNDLMDQRDETIAKLGEIIQVSTLPADDGTVGVFIGGGQRLVLGNEASKVQVVADADDASRSALSLVAGGSSLRLTDDMLVGGSMAGLIHFQNDDLVDARNQLGQMATAFAMTVNQQQALGLDLRDPPQSGDRLFSEPTPLALANAFNAKDASGNYLAKVTLTLSDPSQLQASDYSLEPDGSGVAGQYTLTRLSDGYAQTVNDGDTVDGFTLNVGSPDLQVGDRFLLQPVGRGASGMQRVLDDTDGIAAASPQTATLSSQNTGTASVSLLKMVGGLDDSLSTTITFGDDGSYTYTLNDRDTQAVISNGSGTWTPGQPMGPINGFTLSLNGVPANGDVITVSHTTHAASNNGNALALSALATEPFVGASVDSQGKAVAGATVTDAYAAAMADVGVRVQSANATANVSETARKQAVGTLGSETGVNLDEEAAKLIQFQQAYQAAAKVLQVAQSVFDTMLQLGA